MKANQTLEQQLTLRNLKPGWGDRSIPAFAMNTTAYEDGQRFLLANYKIPDPKPPANGPTARPTTRRVRFLRPTRPRAT